MMDSVRENALNALVVVLGDISVANGYSFDPTVYRAVRELTDPLQPTINVWDQAEETNHVGRALQQAMTVNVEASTDADGGNFSVIGNRLIADLKTAIFGADPQLGGTSEYINLLSSRIEYPDNGSIIVVIMEIVIGYNEQRGEPTLQP